MHLVTKCILLGVVVGIISAQTYLYGMKKQFSKKTALIPDGNGNPHLVDLKRPRGVNITVTLDDFNVYFYNSSSPTQGEHLSPHNFSGTIGKGFDSSKVSIFCAHGWTGGWESETCTDIGRVVLQTGGANWFVIDYSRIAHEFYTISVEALPELGAICGRFVDKILDKYNLSSKQIVFVGHSLGAQLTANCASRMRQKPGTIMGLDPAQPLFSANEPERCLGREDADVVHVLHTNKGLLGFATSIGHADFYANGGGMDQPGCGTDLVGSCAHNRAVQYYAESLTSLIGFKSFQCDSYDHYMENLCQNNHVTYFGGIHLDTKAKGDYYFDTSDASPFAVDGRHQ